MVMAQSLFAGLRQQHPAAAIDVLAPRWTLPLLRFMPEVRRSIEQPLGHGELGLAARYRQGRSLRAAGYDLALVLAGFGQIGTGAILGRNYGTSRLWRRAPAPVAE